MYYTPHAFTRPPAAGGAVPRAHLEGETCSCETHRLMNRLFIHIEIAQLARHINAGRARL